MNVCFLQIETLNNKAREEGGGGRRRREGYGFIYRPNHAKHEAGIYNPELGDGGGAPGRSEIGRDRERRENEAEMGGERRREEKEVGKLKGERMSEM